ncbi:MAG: archaemetzincin family Zn-dependent metalloprotease [Bacteroidetes bacterium]|nr:archaemetzincin family Zn-dependent metalloprotease [Bacteroidota bacterium]
MAQQNITLISYGYFGKQFLEKIAEAVKQEYKFPVNFKESHLDLSEFFDPGRRQYNGNKLLHAVEAISRPEALKTVGLFSVDLFIPILTYIFGQALLNGRTGIVSLYRLSNERYGIEADDKLLLERFTKEVIHELGHTFGLIHCMAPSCVMRSSTYVEDIDQKNQNLCHHCREQLSTVIPDQIIG